MGILDGVEHDFSAVIGGMEHWAGDMETLVEHAVSQVASIGGAGFGDVGLLVEYLIKLGEDPVAVISALVSHISGIGGDVPGTLEEITHGVLTYGLVGFLKMKVEQALSPVKETLQQNIARGQMVADVHHTTLTTMQTKLDLLTTGSNASGMAWQGQGVDAMSTQFADISNVINQLSDQIQHDGTQARLNQAFIIVLEGIGFIAAGLAIVDVLLVIASAVVAVGTLGAGILPAAGFDAAVIGSQLEFLLTLVAGDCLIWLLGTLAIYIAHHPIQLSGATVHPIVTHVPQHAQLPEPRKLTPEEEQEVQAIIDELTAMGFDVNLAWIEYLMRLLGTGMTAKDAGAVIRCMFGKGYLPQIVTGTPPTKMQSVLQRVWNSIKNLQPRDLEGAWKDVHPDRVDYPKGGLPSGANHGVEVSNARTALERAIIALSNAINDPRTPENLRRLYQNLSDAYQKTLDYVNARIYGSDPPLKWSDSKGEIPLGNDLIEKSGCKP